MKKLFFLVFLAICLLFLASTNANAKVDDISQTFWNNPTKIKTYIPQNHKYTAKFKRACAEWSKLTKNGIIFKYTTNQNDAQIRIHFVKQIPASLKADSAAGLTRTSFSPSTGQIRFNEIWIADYVKGHKLSDDEVYTSMLHELGHAIGLGHSLNPNSIMYPSTLHTKTMEISDEDLALLAKKYNWKK